MTGAIWVLLMTGGVAALLAAVSRRRFEEWAAPAVFLLTGVIYVFALAGAPELGWPGRAGDGPLVSAGRGGAGRA